MPVIHGTATTQLNIVTVRAVHAGTRNKNTADLYRVSAGVEYPSQGVWASYASSPIVVWGGDPKALQLYLFEVMKPL